MTHYYIELLLWLLVAYFIGCLIGAVARKLLAKAPQVDAAIAVTDNETRPVSAEASKPLASTQHDPDPLPGRAPLAPRWSPGKEAEEASAEGLQTENMASSIEDSAPQAAALAAPSAVKPRMPVGISAPRAGGPDELQRISGVGPKNEQILHSLGFYHFDQISQWSDEQVEWVDGYLRFNGRIRRENWVEQCRLLAAGDEAEFARLYGTGGMADATGLTRSGEKTRH